MFPEPVHKLGRQLGRSLGKDPVHPERFRELVEPMMDSLVDALDFSWRKMESWLSTGQNFPRQLDAHGSFGQPPITIYADEQKRFVIDLYFWSTIDTVIHDHCFSGVCSLIEGKSYHFKYRFEKEREVTSTIDMGDCRVKSSEILRKGDSFPIDGGDGFIHQIFHVDKPTVTMVARTIGPTDTVQYIYYPPTLRVSQHDVMSVGIGKLYRFYQLLLGSFPERGKSFVYEVIKNREASVAVGMYLKLLTELQSSHILDVCDEAISERDDIPGEPLCKARRHFETSRGTFCHQYLPSGSGSDERFLLAAIGNRGIGEALYKDIGKYTDIPAEEFLMTTLNRMLQMRMPPDLRYMMLSIYAAKEKKTALEEQLAAFVPQHDIGQRLNSLVDYRSDFV